ncbi:hypothetical protein ES703_29249 [subsurface metagenome]
MHNFIRQCEQAEEIQKGHKWKDSDKLAYRRCINVRDCDYEELLKHPEYYEITYRTRKVYENIDIDKPIWIPTQRQLLVISGLSWWRFDERCNEIRRCLLEDPLSEIEVKTKEEAGICVVMEKYNKTWTGEKWQIKE